MQRFDIRLGDVAEVCRALEADSFDGALTDPPYGLSFMGKAWDKGVPSADTWREIFRVLKPGAMLLAFSGTRTQHRLTCAIEDAGFEIRDCLTWLYGSGFPKSHDVSKAIDKAAGAEREIVGEGQAFGRGSMRNRSRVEAGYRPVEINPNGGVAHLTAPATPEAQRWAGYGTALKPAYEPIVLAMKPLDGTFAENALKHGVAGLNIDGSRIGIGHDRTSGGRQGSMPQPMDWWGTATGRERPNGGRWPANLLLNESAAELLDQQSAGVSRFFYCAKASRRERGEGNTHPTVKPLALTEYLAKLILPPGSDSKLLVPFCGSGSETLGAIAAGWQHVTGIEMSQEYAEIAEKRLRAMETPRVNESSLFPDAVNCA